MYLISGFIQVLKIWKVLDFIVAFSRTGKSWKRLLVLESSGNLLNSSNKMKCMADSKEN